MSNKRIPSNKAPKKKKLTTIGKARLAAAKKSAKKCAEDLTKCKKAQEVLIAKYRVAQTEINKARIRVEIDNNTTKRIALAAGGEYTKAKIEALTQVALDEERKNKNKLK